MVQFDLCVSRAVANLSTLSEYCIPYIRVGGIFLSYKSATADEETEQAKKAISILGARIGKREKYTLPECDIHRSFITVSYTHLDVYKRQVLLSLQLLFIHC